MIRAFLFILIISLSCTSEESRSTIKQSTQSAVTPSFTNLFSTEMKGSVACYRIPALITANNGNLIASIDERNISCGDLKFNEDINIVNRISEDNGQSWSEIQMVVDFPMGQSASDPSFILDKTTGEIFLFFNYMDVKNAPNIYFLKYISSKDHGRSWSSPVDITDQITKREWQKDFKFITSGRGIQTKSGKLLHTIVNLENGLHVFGSDDHGENWHLIDTPIKPGDESKIVELNNGAWMINSRINKLGMRYVHTSYDNGRNWQSNPDSTLIDPACNASFIRYSSIAEGDKKNRLLFCNAASKDKRENLTLKISYDEGQTWQYSKTIYAGKAAYSSLSILANGEIGIFFEKNDYLENVFTIVTLDWLTDENDRL